LLQILICLSDIQSEEEVLMISQFFQCYFRNVPHRLCLNATLALIVTSGYTHAGVLQLVNTEFFPGNGGPGVTDSDEVFVPTSADVTTNILASVGLKPPTGNTGYFAASSAGIFGQVGLEARLTGVPQGSTIRSEVLIGSDEFVNVSGSNGSVTSSFIVDGGFINDFFSTNTTVTFFLEVGAQNVGAAGSQSNRIAMEADSRAATGFGGFGGFFPGFEGGRYTATYSTDATGVATFNEIIEGGLDLEAMFNPDQLSEPFGSKEIEIPFSLQTLNLGVLTPGDRLLIGYVAGFEIVQNGISEGVFGGFSDPFSLSSESILSSLQFTPDDDPDIGAIPTPGTLSLVILAGCCLTRVRRQCKKI
jgi:hypothetical protein